MEEVERYNVNMIKAGLSQRPQEPVIPAYNYKYPHLQKRSNYNGTFEDEYWDNWVKTDYSKDTHSWIDWHKLEEEAHMVGYQNWKKMSKVKDILLNGASLGCNLQTSRLPTWGRNSPSVAANGRKFADTLQDWVASGIVNGPFKLEEMPFNNFSVSPMGVTPKPKGKIRIIMDLSHPHDIPIESHLANSVNKGIEKDSLVSKMASTTEVLSKIWVNGHDTLMVKADWNAAYKHISLRHEDRHLQVFSFGGRYFIETQLTFGSSSSPDRFDVTSDLPIEFALRRNNIWKESCAKVLDDMVGFGNKNSPTIYNFYQDYRGICERVGISLADTTDKDKAFGPSPRGVVLGIYYDLEKLQWHIPKEKADRLLSLIWDAIHCNSMSYGTLATLVGKLNHYKEMSVFGKWERSFILALSDTERPPFETVVLNDLAKDQLKWWFKTINMAKTGTSIPDPRIFTPRVFLSLFPDATGGGHGNNPSGAGSFFLTSYNQPWIFVNWPPHIAFDGSNDKGVKFARKMSTLEAYAAFIGLISEPDLVRGKRVAIFTDNAGFFYAFLNGHSRCSFLHTICKAMHFVAKALNITLHVEKVKRRSDTPTIVADMLSKGLIKEALDLLSDPMPNPSRASSVLRSWISNPVPSRTLGELVVEELSHFTSVLDWEQF